MNWMKQIISVTEKAAYAVFPYIGKQDQKSADQAATTAMRLAFNQLPIRGSIVIGEGERDQAPMLYIGEKVGQGFQHKISENNFPPLLGKQSSGFPEIDIAVDPLEGTGLCARGEEGALCVLAIAPKGTLLHAPDVYMDKLACGPKAKGQLNLQNKPSENIKILSETLEKPIHQLKVAVLDRPRHKNLIEEIQTTGVSPILFSDGDVAMSLLTALPDFKDSIDLLLGSGGAPEGVLSAVGLKNLGGDFQGRLLWKNEEQKNRAQKMGIEDFNHVFQRDELVKDQSIFCATGVTHGPLVKGIQETDHQIFMQTFVLSSESQKCQKIENQYSKEKI